MLAQYSNPASDFEGVSCFAGLVSLCLIVAFFVLTSRVYKLLNNAREMRKTLEEMQNQQRHAAQTVKEIRDGQIELLKAAQWFVDEAERNASSDPSRDSG